MSRSIVIGVLAAAAAFLLVRRGNASSLKKIPVQLAAEKLREAWADHHTTA
jgi:hypothetical protein